MAFSGVASAGFILTNGNKVQNGDIGRLPVFFGQVKNAIDAGAKSGTSIAKPAQAVINTCNEIANSDKFFKGLGKTVNFVSNNINPLIIASSGLKIALAKKEDRKDTIISEVGMIGGMFAAEGWMKKNLIGILDKLPISGKWKPIIKGLIFITGSLTGSAIGEKLSKPVYNFLTTPLGKEARVAKQQAQAQTAYKKLDYAA